MDRQMFSNGVSYSSYLEKLPKDQQEGFLKSEQNVRLSEEDRRELLRLKAKVYVMAFSEGWCVDCRINLPVVKRISEAAEAVELRCFSRDANPELIEKLAVLRIPTFIFFNENFNEIGRWVERPANAVEALATENRREQQIALQVYQQGRFQIDTIDEILDILNG